MELSTKNSCNMDDRMDLGESADTPTEFEEDESIETGATAKRDFVKTMRRRKAEYWKGYDLYNNENQRPRALCKHCKKCSYACDSNKNGNKNVRNHFHSCPMNPANKNKGKQSQLIFENTNDNTSELKNWVFNDKDVREAVTEMVITDEMPFRSVEKSGLRRAFFVGCPPFKMPSRTTSSRDCFKYYLKERESLKEFMKVSCQRVCLTTDTWTSLEMNNYMCVTAHFIDNNWKLQKRIINFCLISSHKGEAIGKALEDCLNYWGLGSKILTVTVDNATSNDVACTYLSEIARGKGCVGGGKNLQMRCMAHVINLIVKAGLLLCEVYVDKVRAVVKYIRGSPARLHAFRQQVEKSKIDSKASLCFDVATRWNSTYVMLSVALKLKAAIQRTDIPLEKEMKLGPLTPGDWNKIEMITNFLKEFYNLTKRVSGSSYVTSNYMLFHVHQAVKVLNQMAIHEDIGFKAMAVDMKTKCSKYWGDLDKMNMLMFVALILDPFYKLRGVHVAILGIFGQENADNLVRKVKDYAYGLFDEYKSFYAPLSGESGQSSSRPSLNEEDENSSWLTELNEQVTRGASQDNELSRSEFDSYLIEVKGDHEEKDILTWWKLNGPRYPILARMARDVLAIYISTVPSESTFSTGGRTLDQYRGSLDPSMVQALICTGDWLRANSTSDEEEDLNEGDKIKEDLDKNCPTEVNEGTFFVCS